MTRITLIALIAAVGVTSTAAVAIARGGPDQARLFEAFDTNQDGSITQEEIAAVAATRFANADTDSNGVLTAEEMLAAMDREGTERRAARIERRIERLDTNDDGALSLEESTAGNRRIERMFDRLDADGDGAITQAEAAEARPHRGGRDGGGHRNN